MCGRCWLLGGEGPRAIAVFQLTKMRGAATLFLSRIGPEGGTLPSVLQCPRGPFTLEDRQRHCSLLGKSENEPSS